jgi:hypothetical protein
MKIQIPVSSCFYFFSYVLEVRVAGMSINQGGAQVASMRSAKAVSPMASNIFLRCLSEITLNVRFLEAPCSRK